MEMTRRFDNLRYCSRCRKWWKADEVLDLCPMCGNILRTLPHDRACRRRYHNIKKWTLAEAIEMFRKYRNDGCDVDEALELVEARTGIKLNPLLLEVRVG